MGQWFSFLTQDKNSFTEIVYRSPLSAYYDAIAESSRRGDSGPFIDFMLREILNTLKSHQGEAIDVGTNVGENERKVLSILSHSPQTTAKELSEVLGVTLRQCERILASMKQKGLIVRVGANKNGHWEVLTRKN